MRLTSSRRGTARYVSATFQRLVHSPGLSVWSHMSPTMLFRGSVHPLFPDHAIPSTLGISPMVPDPSFFLVRTYALTRDPVRDLPRQVSYSLITQDPGNNQGLKLWTCYPGLFQQTWYYTDDRRIAITGGNQCLDEGTNGVQTYQCTPGNTNQSKSSPFGVSASPFKPSPYLLADFTDHSLLCDLEPRLHLQSTRSYDYPAPSNKHQPPSNVDKHQPPESNRCQSEHPERRRGPLPT